VEITTLTTEHLIAADELRRLVGWNQTRQDWARLLSLEPDGCFVAIERGEVIGTVTTTTFGQQLAWIGLMLVHPDHRRRGIGTRLMERALEFLRGRGIGCVRLDATPAGRPVYEKLGFVPEWSLTRCQGNGAAGQDPSGTRELTESDWSEIEKLDSAAFGVSRTRLLRVFAESSRLALVWPAEGRILGHGMLRPGSHSDYLGPVVCADEDGALCLVAILLKAAGVRSVFWDVPDQNAPAQRLAKHFGFNPVRSLTRMRLGDNSVGSDPVAQLAIADPSVG
jgi:predicted N-acetyltransferase YhbS